MVATVAYTKTGIFGATATILVTTLDDCVWLVPYLAGNSSNRIVVLQHAFLFAITLICLTTLVGYGTLFVQLHSISWIRAATVNDSHSSEDIITSDTTKLYDILAGAFGATLCWTFAGYFYCKSVRKRRRKRQKQELDAVASSNASTDYTDIQSSTTTPLITGTSHDTINLYGSTTEHVSLTSEAAPSCETNGNESGIGMMTAQPWSVVALTITGALDEVSYFPALIVGKVFTVTELIIAACFTVGIMLLIVTQFLSKCRPLLQCLDRIPLYGIITLFAIILTIDVVWDAIIAYNL
jgi:hypothetical protein